MTQPTAQIRHVVSRTGFSNPLTLGVLVEDIDYLKVYADEELLQVGVDYNVLGIGDANGPSIEIIGAEDPNEYVGVETFTALYDPVIQQGANLALGGSFGRAFEAALDTQNRQLQALAEKVDRALKMPVNVDGDIVLPPPVDQFGLIWDADTQAFVWAAVNDAGAIAASLPSGGLDGQLLAKASDDDFDTEWIDGAFNAQAISFTPTGGLAATNVQAALAEVDSEKLTSAPADARSSLDTAPHVATRTALKALDTTKDTVAILTEAGREGTFIWRSGDYSSHITADTEEGVYVKADAVASSSGAWVREISGEALNVDWFGAAPNTTTDSQPAIQAAYDLIVATAGITEGMMGRIVAPSGKYRLGSSLEFSKPVGFYCPGYLEYTPTSGSALIIGASIPTDGQNTGYDIKIGGMRAINGNAAAPTGYNSSGCSGVEVRNMQFSTLWVGRIIAFTKAGFWGNQTNDVYALQHCQDNTIHLGDVAYCGEGVRIESVDAALGAFQVNWVQVQNSFGNWTNFRIGGSGDNNSNNNIFVFHAMDADTGGGAGFVRGLYNDIQFGYADGEITFESGSAYNRCFAQVGAAQVVFTDAGTSNEIKRATEGWTTPNTNSPPIRVESTDAGASVAELIKLKRSSASPAANDGGAAIGFYFNDDGGTERLGARIRTDMPSVEAGGNRNTRLIFDTIVGGSADVRAILWQGLSVGNVADQGSGTVNALTAYYQNSVKVVGARRTGWAAATGTATRTTFATGSVTLPQLAERVKALIDDLIAHGLIGA